MMQEVEVLKTIQELICSFFSEEQFTLSISRKHWTIFRKYVINISIRGFIVEKLRAGWYGWEVVAVFFPKLFCIRCLAQMQWK